MSATVTARLFDADGRDREVELDRELVGSLTEHQLLWVDVERDDGADLDALGEALGLDARDIRRLEHETARARLLRSEDRLHLTLETLEPDDSEQPRLERREIDLIAGPNMVLTVHPGRSAALDRFIDGLEGETRMGALSAAELLSALVDEVLGDFFRVADLIQREIDELDQRALRSRPEDDVLARIVAVRRRIGMVRRTLAPHREAFAALARPETRVDELLGEPWAGLPDRLERALDAVDMLRDALLGTYDVHMGRVAQRTNEVMKALTMLSGILLPSAVLAGIMGMNFRLPFFEEPSNFMIVIASMIGFAILILAVARMRRWV